MFTHNHYPGQPIFTAVALAALSAGALAGCSAAGSLPSPAPTASSTLPECPISSIPDSSMGMLSVMNDVTGALQGGKSLVPGATMSFAEDSANRRFEVTASIKSSGETDTTVVAWLAATADGECSTKPSDWSEKVGPTAWSRFAAASPRLGFYSISVVREYDSGKVEHVSEQDGYFVTDAETVLEHTIGNPGYASFTVES